MTVLNTSLCEVPLCSLAIIDFSSISSEISFTQEATSVKVNNLSITSLLTIDQTLDYDVGWVIESVLSLASTLDADAIYTIAQTDALALAQNINYAGIFTANIVSSVQLSQALDVIYAIDLELCERIELVSKIANAVEVSLTDTLTFLLTEWDHIASELVISSEILTNMDDLTCERPYGYTGDKSSSDVLDIVSDVSATLVINVSLTHELTILNTFAWR